MYKSKTEPSFEYNSSEKISVSETGAGTDNIVDQENRLSIKKNNTLLIIT